MTDILLIAGLWRFSRDWQLPAGPVARWIICAILLLAAYYVFGRALQPRLTKRTYRYAE